MVVALLLGGAPSASAHAYLDGTNPADGSVLDRAPDRLSLSFSEHVVLDATTIEVVDGRGRVITLTDLRLDTDAPGDTEAPAVVSADLPDLPRDAYRVRWSTLSADDLHRTSGFFVFGVGTPVTAAGFSEPAPQVGESGLRWLLLLGVALALGSLLVTRCLPGEPDATRVRHRMRSLGRTGAVGALLASVALLADQAAAGGLSWHALTTSGYAGRWALRELGLLALLVAAMVPVSARARRPLVVAGAGATAVGSALLGHAGADPGAAYLRVVATAVHLLAMLTWAGGVLCLAAILVRGVVGGGTGDTTVRVLLRRFGAPAVTCLGVGVASGLLLTSSTVVSVDAALATAYGRALLVKIGLVGLMALLALGNHRRLRGRHDLDLPRRGVAVEAVAALLVLAATGVLTSAQPATESRFVAAPAATRGPVPAEAGDLHVTLDVAPNAPGVNVVSIDVFDTRRPAPGRVTAVALRVDGSDVAATPLGDGRWTVAGLDLPAGGTTMRVTVTRPGLPDVSAASGWTVGAGDGVPGPVVSNAPLRTPLRGLAVVVLLGGVAAAVVVRRRRGGAGSAPARSAQPTTALPVPGDLQATVMGPPRDRQGRRLPGS